MAARLPRATSSLARPLAHSKPLSSSSSASKWSRSQATLSSHSQSYSGSRKTRYGTLAGFLLVGAGGAGLLSSTYVDGETDTQTARLASAYSYNSNKSHDPLDILDPDVLSSSTAHLRSLPLSQLFRAYLVFLTSQSSFIVDIAPSAVTAFEKIRDTLPFGAGQAIWHTFLWSMRHTFFAQFVAGESVTETYPLLEKLYSETHTGAMLNWSAEAEHATLSAEESESEQSMLLEPAMGELRRAVLAAADFRKEQQVKPTTLAIKLTGLVKDPAVFQRSTEAILSSTANARGQIDTTTLVPPSPLLTPADVATLNGLHSYLRTLCSVAQERGLRIVFDAEQSWFQPSLDRLVTSLSREFNKPSSHGLPVVYNTYQANLQGCEAALRRDLADSKQQGYNLGIKLVRGAYVVSENAHAVKRKQESKVWNNKQETDKCFDNCSAIILDEIDQTIIAEKKDGPAVIFATHNAGSVKRSIEQLRDRNLVKNEGDHLVVDDRIRGRVAYAQLLAMADSLTAAMSTLFPPSQAGQNTTPINSLYVPYGKIGEVLPYLVRRAQENKSILQGSDGSGRGGAAAQRRAIGREIRRRAFGFAS